MAKKGKKSEKQVESLKHKDKRKNIPTEELRGFVAAEEPESEYMLYPRDPSLDPQLVWKGKDAQDAEELSVPITPIYIQEKIHPEAIVENVRAEAEKDRPKQVDLFDDFNGIPFEKMVDFYHHEQNWSNRMILGDSLAVMTSLAEKEGLKGQVQMVYIDPPYGIQFASNWQVSTRDRSVKDGNAKDATRQPEQIRAFRDTWQLGIHSYLAYWRDRLVAARELLSDSGSVVVQIGDENVHLVRSLLDEVMGNENFVGDIIFVTSTGRTSKYIDCVGDHLIWYAKDSNNLKYHQLYFEKKFSIQGDHKDLGGEYNLADLSSQHPSKTRSVPYEFRKKIYNPPDGRQWATDPDTGLPRLEKANRIVDYSESQIRFKKYITDYPVSKLHNIWMDTQFGAYRSEKIYVVQTNTKAVQRILLMTTDPGDLVLDPTCGSGTTAYVAEQWGRRWITADTSRVALALARTRLMASRFSYYILSDSPEGAEKESEITGLPRPDTHTEGDIRKGFVYERAPHVTLRDIAHNEEIDEIHDRWQPKQDEVCMKLNEVLGTEFEEWELPHEPGDDWPKGAKKLLEEFRRLKSKRQEEIDASIARRSEQEILYDRPYEDSRKVRVTGPFTVESLSPHRNISIEDKKHDAEEGRDGWTVKELGPNQFGHVVIENLKTAGVQNTVRGERMVFDVIEPYAGQWIHAEGQYTDSDGESHRIAISIGPEHGTVGPELIREAAKEAVQGVGFDTLVVCGFAFDPHVSEEAKRYGKLVVLPTRINADLQMGGEFLKKTGAANLFMVFGEPDIDIERLDDGRVQVEIKGVDIYDPTTGQIRSSSTDDIACWFIDTSYNGESFFVRHAYFCGADNPYDRLKKSLRAEIDEAAWSMLYATESQPFGVPETDKIAIKVINHYGDEVLKVYEVPEKKPADY